MGHGDTRFLERDCHLLRELPVFLGLLFVRLNAYLDYFFVLPVNCVEFKQRVQTLLVHISRHSYFFVFLISRVEKFLEQTGFPGQYQVSWVGRVERTKENVVVDCLSCLSCLVNHCDV